MQLLRSQWAPVENRLAWEKLEEHLPREYFSWNRLPDAVCDDVLEAIFFTEGARNSEDFNAAVGLMFLKHCEKPAAGK